MNKNFVSTRGEIYNTTKTFLEARKELKKPEMRNYENIQTLLKECEKMEEIILREAIKSGSARWPLKTCGLVMVGIAKELRKAKLRVLN